MKKNNSKLKKVVFATAALMVLASFISTSALAEVTLGGNTIHTSSYDSVTGITTLTTNLAGTTKTYLVAEKNVDVSSKTLVTPTNVTTEGSIVKYDISAGSITKLYGNATISYGDFYYAEVENVAKVYGNTTFDGSEVIENDVKNKSEDGQYDSLTSATIAKSSVKKTTSFLGKIPKNVISTVKLTQAGYDSLYPGTNAEKPNIFPISAIFTPVASVEEEGIIMSGIKDIKVSIDYDTLVNALALKELRKETALSTSFLERVEEITNLTTDSSGVGYVKPLLKDGSYGKKEIVHIAALNPIAKNGYTKTTYQYGSKSHGEYIAFLYIDGAGMDKATLAEYTKKLSAGTVKNNRTGKADGLFSIQHIWGSSDHVEIAFAKTEGTVHYEGKFKDLSVGANSDDYTITLMAEGYEDLVVNNINFDKFISGVTTVRDTFKVSGEKAKVVLNLANIESQFRESLNNNSTYTLTKKVEKVNVDCSSYLDEISGNTVSIKDLKSLVSEHGDGVYTLAVKANDYANISLSLNIENDVVEEVIPVENIQPIDLNTSTENNGASAKTGDTNSVVALSVLSLLSGLIIAYRKKLKLIS